MKAMEKLLLVLMVMAVANLVGKQEACGMCPGGVCTGYMHVTNTETTVQRLGQHHGSVRNDFDFDGRHVNVVLPEHVRGRSELPMVIALIGFGVPGEVMLTDAGGPGFGKLAETDDVIVVAPDPSVHPVLGTTFWNATDACCGFESVFGPQVDDVDYLTRLTDTLLDRSPSIGGESMLWATRTVAT
jgi:poly(3-hydroxybutyrate) depolymerase